MVRWSVETRSLSAHQPVMVSLSNQAKLRRNDGGGVAWP